MNSLRCLPHAVAILFSAFFFLNYAKAQPFLRSLSPICNPLYRGRVTVNGLNGVKSLVQHPYCIEGPKLQATSSLQEGGQITSIPLQKKSRSPSLLSNIFSLKQICSIVGNFKNDACMKGEVIKNLIKDVGVSIQVNKNAVVMKNAEGKPEAVVVVEKYMLKPDKKKEKEELFFKEKPERGTEFNGIGQKIREFGEKPRIPAGDDCTRCLERIKKGDIVRCPSVCEDETSLILKSIVGEREREKEKEKEE